MKSKLDRNSSKLRSQTYVIEGLKKQIIAEKSKILGISEERLEDKKLNQYISEFKLLTMEVDLT
jgi:capsule polysaccharide export protein KpsE/RkpR